MFHMSPFFWIEWGRPWNPSGTWKKDKWDMLIEEGKMEYVDVKLGVE